MADCADVTQVQGYISVTEPRLKLVAPSYRSYKKLVLGPGSIASETATHRLCLHLACTQSDQALRVMSARVPQLTVPLQRMRAVRERIVRVAS
jgi:hypothetical protein